MIQSVMDWLTVDHLTLALVVMLAAERLLRRIAPLTATRRDDELLEQIDRARAWVREYAPLIVGIVEDLAATGRIPAAAKAREYLARLEAEWAAAHPGQPLPPQASAEARLIAAGIAAQLPHASDRPADPRPGPGSR